MAGSFHGNVIRVHFLAASAFSCAASVSSLYIRWPAIGICINLLQQTLLLEIVGDDLDSLLHTGLLAVNVDLGVLGSLVRSADTSELLDLASASLLVQTLGVALLSLLDGNVDEDLDEGERRLVVLGVVVEVTGNLAVGLVGGDKGGESDGGAVGEELGDLREACQRRWSKSSKCVPMLTSAIRLMFSSLSLGEKPRSLFRPKRTLSPSSL